MLGMHLQELQNRIKSKSEEKSQDLKDKNLCAESANIRIEAEDDLD